MKKTCNKCGEEKATNLFYKKSGNKDGLRGDCKDCYKAGLNREEINARAKEYYQRNKEEKVQGQREWRKNNREKSRESSRGWAERNSEYVKKYRRKRYLENVVAIKADMIRRRKEDPEAERARVAKWKKNNPEKVSTYLRRGHLKFSYGLTMSDYEGMLFDQWERCAICGVHKNELKRKLSVDHDHETGKVRALLCGKCNTGIGAFQDSTETMNHAIDYLAIYSGEN